MPRPRHRRVAVLIALVCAALVAACAPPPPTPPVGFDQHYLTRDGHDTTGLQLSSWQAGRVVAGTSNTGGNSRTVFTRRSDSPGRDHEVCVRFRHSGGMAQEGVAFRVRNDGGRVRAVTVTKNIFSSANWVFNVHTWDTARPGVFRLQESLDMSPAVGRRMQGHETWNLCGRAVGTRVDVRVWRQGGAEPGWDHPTVRSTRIPGDFTAPGMPGWYAGHVERGHWTDLSAMSSTLLGADGLS